MLEWARSALPARILAVALALGVAAAAAAVDGGAGVDSPSSAPRPAREAADIVVVSGFLDRDGASGCFSGSHQLRDACSGRAVPLQSTLFDLDADLCAYVEVLGDRTGIAAGVVKAMAVRETSSRCGVDCDADGRHDECAVRHDLAPDCNGNDLPDRCDIGNGASSDCNGDGIPDECQLAACDLNDGVIMMSVEGRDRIVWFPERSFNSFNVHRGSLSWLAGAGEVAPGAPPADPGPSFGQKCDIKEVTLRDDLVPAAGEAFYYVITGNRFGAEQRTSIDSIGARRSNAGACPAPAGPLDVSVRTDKAIYDSGETVRIEVFLANLNPTGEIDLRFATPCKVTFRVEDREGAGLYLDLSHHSCAYEDHRLTLRPGQIATYSFAWDQRDDRGGRVAPNNGYVIRGMVLHRDPVPDGITGISIRP